MGNIPLSQRKHIILPSGRSPCLCCSGEKFKQCCVSQIDNIDGINELSPTSGLSKKQILRIARAKFSRYQIWHLSHTMPFYKADPKSAENIFSIDIKALAELLARLRMAYEIQEPKLNFGPVLNCTESLIDHPLWYELHNKQKLLYLIREGEDLSEAERFAESVDLDKVNDPDFLTALLSTRSDLNIAKRLKHIDRILQNSDDWETKLRLWTLRGHLWTLQGDSTEEVESFENAISVIPDNPKPSWSYYHIVSAYQSAARALSRDELYEKADELCKRFLDEVPTESEFYLDLLKARSSLRGGMGNYEAAMVDLKEIVHRRGTNDDKIQLAQGYVYQRDTKASREILESINYDELTEGERWDHSYAIFGTLLDEQDPDLAELLYTRLLKLNPEFPHWRELRLQFLASLQEIRRKEDFPSWWKELRASIMLEPNIFGVGLNVTGIIDRFFERRSAKQKSANNMINIDRT